MLDLFFCQYDLLHRNDRTKYIIQLCKIPIFRKCIIIDDRIHIMLYHICDHLVDRIAHTLAIEYLTTLFIDYFTLLVVDTVKFKQVLSDTKVITFDLLLCTFDRIRKHLMFDLLSLRHCFKQPHQTF